MKLKLLILILILTVGCKTKHKVIERETQKEETKKEVAVNETTQNNVVVNTSTNIGNDVIKIKNFKQIDLRQADPNKTITISDETGKTLFIQGADAVIKSSEEIETQKDTIAILGSSIDKSKTTKNNTSKEETKKDNTKRKADSDVKTTSTWLWIILILLALSILYLNRKRFIN